MPAFRHLLVLIAAAGAAAVFAAPSSAAVDQCAGSASRPGVAIALTASDPAFRGLVHERHGRRPATSPSTQASDFAALLEHVYATEIALRVPGSDERRRRQDRRLHHDAALPDAVRDCRSATPAPGSLTSSGYIEIDPSVVGDSFQVHVAAHEFFHLIQFASWVRSSKTDTWLWEGAAEWMGAKVDGYQDADVESTVPSDMPLDCRDDLTRRVRRSATRTCTSRAATRAGRSSSTSRSGSGSRS